MAISYKALADYQQGNDQTAREDLIYAISLIFDKSNKGEIGLAQFIEEIENNLDEGKAMFNQEPREMQLWGCKDTECQDYHAVIEWSYKTLAEKGEPVCPTCDGEMRILEDEDVTTTI